MRKQKVQRRLLAESDELQEKAAKINAEEKEMTMLSAINNILELAEDSKLSAEFFEQADPYMKYVCKVQGITPMQTVMLSYFLEEGSNHPQVSISELAMFLNCRTIRVLEYQEELEELIKRGILYKSTNSRDDSVSYIVPKRMIESLYKNQPYQRVSYACEGIKLFHHVYDITHLRYKEYLSTELMRAEVERLFEENKDCHYVKYLHSLGLDKDDELVLTQMSRHLVLGGVDCIPLDHLAFLFDHPYTKNTFIRSMEDGSHSLLRKGLVEMAFDGGFKNREGFRLSNGIRANLLKEYNIKISEDDVQCDVIKCDKIVS